MSSFLTDIDSFVQMKISPNENGFLNHAFQQGKKVRPRFLEEIIDYYQLPVDSFVPAGAAIELIHAGSLIHDDIADGDTIRREKPSFATQYGIPKALLFGDYLLAEALSIFTEYYAQTPLARKGLEVLQKMILAQWNEANGRVKNEQDYLSYVSGKTTSLFELCARIPPLIAGKDSLPKVEAFATAYGTCFQLLDDLSEEHPERELNILNFVSRGEAIQKVNELKSAMRVSEIIPEAKWIFP